LSYDGLRARGLTVRTRLQLFLARFLSSFGLIRCFEVIDGLRVGLSASYHAEFVPPPDTYAAGTELLVYQTETRHDQTQTRDDPIIHTYGPPVVDPQEHRPHVNVDALEAATTSPLNLPRGVHGRLTLRFQARRESLVFPLLVAAVVITGTVWFVELRASTKTGIDGPTLAVLLVVPFALATYFVRSAENNYVTRMLRWVRITAAIPVLAGVFVIAAKGLGFLDVRGPHVKEVSDWTFDWAAHARWITVVSTGLLTVAWLAPMLMRNGRRIGNAVRCVYAWLSPRNDLGHPWPPPGAGYRS
jgi:hypothetical protein